jgi:GT2 family glycosyltransferase
VEATSCDTPLISVVIVNYKVPELVTQAVRSIKEAALAGQTEIIVVDNASEDRSRQIITSAFSDVIYVGLKANIGFGKASNLGARRSRGQYLLMLNPDAVISHNTLEVCRDFLQEHPQVGILGPKILNPDGSLQSGCRRSFPTPFNSFCHLFGLARLFPNSKRCSAYTLSSFDPDLSMEVDAISGSFMFMPRQVFGEIGGFDEAFFMYGEDLDLCAKAKQKGYQVWYHPGTQIIHFKGQSSRKLSLRSRTAFYQAMVLFSRKYRNSYGAFFPGWLIAVGIGVQAGINIATVLASSALACLIDIAIINVCLAAGILIRFANYPFGTPYQSGLVHAVLAMHGLITVFFVGTYLVRGIYSSERYTPLRALSAGLGASLLFLASFFFFKSMAFSRLAFALTAIVTSFALVGWREIMPPTLARIRQRLYSTGGVVIVGNAPVASLLIKNIEADTTATIRGIVWPTEQGLVSEFEGHPVLGSLREIGPILEHNRADLLLIATEESWYSHVIEALARHRLRNLTIKWVSHELLRQPPQQLPAIIPLQNFSVQ